MSMWFHAKRMRKHLEHLDVGDREVEIGGIAEDKTTAEEEADRQDGTNESFS